MKIKKVDDKPMVIHTKKKDILDKLICEIKIYSEDEIEIVWNTEDFISKMFDA